MTKITIFFNAFLHDSEYYEYVVFMVGTHMRMVRHLPTLLGQCPKFDQIFFFTASLSQACIFNLSFLHLLKLLLFVLTLLSSGFPACFWNSFRFWWENLKMVELRCLDDLPSRVLDLLKTFLAASSMDETAVLLLKTKKKAVGMKYRSLEIVVGPPATLSNTSGQTIFLTFSIGTEIWKHILK